jgi:hypothetical protein
MTETKNATLLRIWIVILAVHYTATSPHFCNSRPEAGGRHPQLTARPTAPLQVKQFYLRIQYDINIDDEP